MKNTLKTTLLLLLTTLSSTALLASSSAHRPMTQATVDQQVFVRHTSGAPQFSTDGNSWAPVLAGRSIPTGATVRSPNGSEAVLDMEQEGTMVKVSSGTELKLEKSEQQIARENNEARELAGSAKIRAIRGRAEIFSNDAWQPLQVNSVVKRGSILRTRANSTLDMIFREKGLFVRMTPETVVRIDQLDFTWEGMSPVIESLLLVPQGAIQTNGRKSNTSGGYHMRTAQVLYHVSGEANDANIHPAGTQRSRKN